MFRRQRLLFAQFQHLFDRSNFFRHVKFFQRLFLRRSPHINERSRDFQISFSKSTKSQPPNPREAQIIKIQSESRCLKFEYCGLEIVWGLELGVWSLRAPARVSGPASFPTETL